MGWLCPQCGAENAPFIRRCDACGESVSFSFRAWNQICALCERLYAGEPVESDAWGPWGVFPKFFRANCLTRTFLRVQAFAAFIIVVSAWTNGGFSVRELPESVSYAGTLERHLEQVEKVIRSARDSERGGIRKLDEFCKSAGIPVENAPSLSPPDETGLTESRVSERVADITDAYGTMRSRSSQQWETLTNALKSLCDKVAFWKPYLEGRDEI